MAKAQDGVMVTAHSDNGRHATVMTEDVQWHDSVVHNRAMTRTAHHDNNSMAMMTAHGEDNDDGACW